MNAQGLRDILRQLSGENDFIFGETTGTLIEQLNRLHAPNECSCPLCRDMCKRAPCIGTPQDIMRIAQAGHIDVLAPTDYFGLWEFGVPNIQMVQIRALDVNEWKSCGGGQCSLWDSTTGLCRVHGIKPIEGRFAGHTATHIFTSATWVAALAWMIPPNQKLIRHLFSLVGVYPEGERPPASTPILLPSEGRPA